MTRDITNILANISFYKENKYRKNISLPEPTPAECNYPLLKTSDYVDVIGLLIKYSMDWP